MVNLMCLILQKSWTIFLSNFKPLRLSDPAKADLQHIANYTEQQWGNVQKKHYLALINRSLSSLSELGNIGKKRHDLEVNLYSFCIKKHVVYFREAEHEYCVLRILHSYMDPESHLL